MSKETQETSEIKKSMFGESHFNNTFYDELKRVLIDHEFKVIPKNTKETLVNNKYFLFALSVVTVGYLIFSVIAYFQISQNVSIKTSIKNQTLFTDPEHKEDILEIQKTVDKNVVYDDLK